MSETSMTEPMTIETTIHFRRERGRSKQASTDADRPLPEGHLPRITKLMALAIKLGKLLEEGLTTHSDLARLGQVTPARMSQILNLLHLAPDLQEELLFLPKVRWGRAPMKLMDLQRVCAIEDWEKQRRRWRELV